jgi:radical SAM superfamily enzyme YgiQ (UPF0313 family)
LIGFSCYVWNIKKILVLASAIKKNLPQTLIILGGPETAGLDRKILGEYSYIDGVVTSEGEEIFKQVLTGWLQKDKLNPIPGISIRQENRLYIGPACLPIKNLNKIPSPYDYLKSLNFKTFTPLQTLRGCNRKCLYCYCGKNFSTVRFFSLERIEEDLEKIKKNGGKGISIIDPNFFCHYDHAAGVIRILSEKEMRFQVEVNAEDLNEKAIDLLADSTCVQVNFGLQSSNPATLKLCGRNPNLERFENNIRKLAEKSSNINLYMDIIYGLPGDTFTDFLNSIDFAFSLPVEIIVKLNLIPSRRAWYIKRGFFPKKI